MIFKTKQKHLFIIGYISLMTIAIAEQPISNPNDVFKQEVITMTENHNIVKDSKFLSILVRAAKESGKHAMKGFQDIQNLATTQKTSHPNDILTEYDQISQDVAIQILKSEYPEFKVVGEENEDKFPEGWNQGYTWVIDPIDGTLNFRYGRKDFAISIALFKDGVPIAGVIYAPARHEIYYAEDGKGAYLNGVAIRVKSKPVTSVPLCHFELNKIENEDFIAAVRPLASSLTQYGGSAALDLAFTAAGLNDTVLSTNLSLWDIGAGIIIMQEAGGVVVSPNGGKGFIQAGEGACHHLAGHPDSVNALLDKLPAKTVAGIEFGRLAKKFE